MKTFILAAALAVFPSLAYAEDMTGLKLLPVTATHHTKSIETAVWYPSSGGKSLSFGENPVFQGIAVQEGAEVAPGRYPIVLLSHGLGGNYRTLGWLGARACWACVGRIASRRNQAVAGARWRSWSHTASRGIAS